MLKIDYIAPYFNGENKQYAFNVLLRDHSDQWCVSVTGEILIDFYKFQKHILCFTGRIYKKPSIEWESIIEESINKFEKTPPIEDRPPIELIVSHFMEAEDLQAVS